MRDKMLVFLKKQKRKLFKGGLLYNDNLWIISYIIGCLPTLNAILDEYNVSAVSDSNPIAMALAGGFYLVCSVVVGYMYLNFKFMRIGIVEAIYMVLRLIGFAFDSFIMLLLLRLCCLAVCFCLSYIIFRPIFKKCKEDKVLDSLCISGIVIALMSIIVFVAINRVKIGMMIGGGIVAIIAFNLLGIMGDGIEISGVSSGNFASTDNESVESDMNTSDGQSERIAFSNYDISRGDIGKDFNRIDF